MQVTLQNISDNPGCDDKLALTDLVLIETYSSWATFIKTWWDWLTLINVCWGKTTDQIFLLGEWRPVVCKWKLLIQVRVTFYFYVL